MRYICIVTSELTPERIRAALAENSGNIAATARELGVSRATLYRWMKAHAIGVERVVRAA
jgi:transcriptional regulator of acetoin/glycerol metabolism